MSDDEKAKSWWQTLPGILTNITATITAVAGLLVAINQTGWFSRSASNTANHAAAPPVGQFRLLIDGIPQAPSGDLNELVDGNSAKEGEVTFVLPQSTSTLKLRIQVSDEKTDIPLGFIRG